MHIWNSHNTQVEAQCWNWLTTKPSVHWSQVQKLTFKILSLYHLTAGLVLKLIILTQVVVTETALENATTWKAIADNIRIREDVEFAQPIKLTKFPVENKSKGQM